MYQLKCLSIIFFISLFFVNIFIAPPSFAGLKVSSNGDRNIDLGLWNGSSRLSITKDICVTSVLGKHNRSITASPYQVKLFSRLNTSIFSLSMGNQSLPFTVRFIDLYNLQSETLQANQFSAKNKTGALDRCPLGYNGQIEISINKNDLIKANAGNYRSRYILNIQGGDNGTEITRLQFNIRTQINDLIRVSNIGNIQINATTSASPIQEKVSVCVYRNSFGSYQVTATGNGTHGFNLKNGIEILNYTAFWHDGNTTTKMISGIPLTNRRNPNTQSPNCEGGIDNNAELTIEISETNINNTPAGIYNGILTLLIATE